jgi:hypothetical protein
MTIHLGWWAWPVGLLIISFMAGAGVAATGKGDYDFGTPLVVGAIFFAGIVGAVALCIGHWFL